MKIENLQKMTDEQLSRTRAYVKSRLFPLVYSTPVDQEEIDKWTKIDIQLVNEKRRREGKEPITVHPDTHKIATGFPELDSALGKGFPLGSFTALGGSPLSPSGSKRSMSRVSSETDGQKVTLSLDTESWPGKVKADKLWEQSDTWPTLDEMLKTQKPCQPGELFIIDTTHMPVAQGKSLLPVSMFGRKRSMSRVPNHYLAQLKRSDYLNNLRSFLDKEGGGKHE